MAETGAVFGGEHSGHYYFADNYRADSGIIAALVVLELMSRSARSLSELLQPFRRYADSGEINTEVTDPAGTVALLAAEVAKADGALGVADDLDGLTVDRGDWWYNLRPSNTEPLLRLNVEAPDDESCQRHVTEILSDIERLTAG
jgi:phosphomannomutase